MNKLLQRLRAPAWALAALGLILGQVAALAPAVLVAPVAIVALAPAPAHATQFFPSATGANVNLDNTTESQGFLADGVNDGQGTLVTAGATVNTKTATPVAIGSATANALAGLKVFLGPGSASNRSLVDLCTDSACATVIAPNLPVLPGTTTVVEFDLPLNLAAGTQVYSRSQSSTGSTTVRVAYTGTIRNASSPPLYSAMVMIDPTITSSLPGGNVNFSSAANAATGWTQVLAAGASNVTVDEYDAFLLMSASNSSPSTTQGVQFHFGVGASSPPATQLVSFGRAVQSGSAYTGRPELVFMKVAAGSKLWLEITSQTQGANDKLNTGVWGFKP